MRGVYYDLVAMFPVAAEDDFCLRREAGLGGPLSQAKRLSPFRV